MDIEKRCVCTLCLLCICSYICKLHSLLHHLLKREKLSTQDINDEAIVIHLLTNYSESVGLLTTVSQSWHIIQDFNAPNKLADGQ